MYIMKNLLEHIRVYKKGITLLEAVIYVGIFTVVMLVILNTIASFYRFNGYTIAQSYQVSYARDGMELLVRDLREMTFADNGTFPLAVMETNRVAFYSDIDRDNSVEYVEYRLASTTLYKTIYNATGSPPIYASSSASLTTAVSQYVQNSLQNIPIFIYYDGDGNPAVSTTTVTDITYIQISLIINVDPIRDPGEFLLRSSASLRNLR